MDDATLRRRLDAALLLLIATFLLVLALAFRLAPEVAVGSVVLSALVGYGLVRRE